MHAQSLSCVQLFETPWTSACQALLSMGFPRKEYWNGLPLKGYSGDGAGRGVQDRGDTCIPMNE